MCNWRNADNRGGARSVVAVRLGRGKGCIPCLFLFNRKIIIKKGEKYEPNNIRQCEKN